MKGSEAFLRLKALLLINTKEGKLTSILDLLNDVEKELKALEIVKEKNFDLYYLQDSKDLEMYNDACDHYRNLCYLTQEEFDLLKEVLS